MTTAQAYHILGLGPGAGRSEIERAYNAALRAVQLQLVPGTPLAVRQRAQGRIAELKTAFEHIKNTAPTRTHSKRAGRHSQSQAKPVAGCKQRPTTTGPARPAALNPVVKAPNPVILASLVLAMIVTLFAVLSSVRSTASGNQDSMAQLRILSVPWSYVEVDGTPLGPSGQMEPFTLKPGEHKLVLRQGDTVLERNIFLRGHSETIVKAQLEKGLIDVIHK